MIAYERLGDRRELDQITEDEAVALHESAFEDTGEDLEICRNCSLCNPVIWK